jgi:hypothetical protein
LLKPTNRRVRLRDASVVGVAALLLEMCFGQESARSTFNPQVDAAIDRTLTRPKTFDARSIRTPRQTKPRA